MSNLNRDENRMVWADIPVSDLNRAVEFYSKVLNISVQIESYGDVEFAVLEHDKGNGACLVVEPSFITEGGTLNYYNVHGRINDAVKLVAELGGKVIQDVHAIGPFGHRAIVLDSEGNRIALHSEVG